ncbi:MAG: DNA polymerase III subunit delta' [Thiohalocapsa sp.]
MRNAGETAATEASKSAPAPRANPDLIGHADAEHDLRRLFEAGRLPHALLLSGPRGIGKATLAFRLARFVLLHAAATSAPDLFAPSSEVGASRAGGDEGLAVPPDSGTFRRVAAGSHADLLTVERGYDPRRRRLRGEIVVDDTREVAAFLRLTAAEGGWRVVIVDGADMMNRNAANALLKILEEPPPRTVLLLVAHSVGRLLPTIRSRCRHLALRPLPTTQLRQLLRRYRPDLAEPQAEALLALAAGSIGRALDLAASGGVALYEEVLALLRDEGGLDAVRLHGFADRLARNDADDSYRVVEDLLAQLLADFALMAAGHEAAEGARGGAALRHLAGRAPAARWAELRDAIGRDFARTDALNLDRKQTVLGAFLAIDGTRG